MIDFVVGAGQGGCRIAKVFGEEFVVPVTYLNLAQVDFSQLDVPKVKTLVIDADGTGRNPAVGEKIAKENKHKVGFFLEDQLSLDKGSRAVVCVGGGGGSGAGLMYSIVDRLLRARVNVLLVYTLPEKREGLPAKPNALKSLNKVISKYLEKDRIACLVVDNSFCTERFGSGDVADVGAYWDRVNQGIIQGLRRYWLLTNLEQYTNYFDVTAGYGALDGKELTRILYTKGGFVDLREFVCTEPDPEVAKTAKFRSLVFGNLDIASTKNYIVTVGFPYEMKDDNRVHEFSDVIFKKLERITKTPFVLRSSHFNKKIKEIHVNVLLSGLVKSHGLKKIVSQTVRDVEKYKSKDRIEKLDLTDIDL